MQSECSPQADSGLATVWFNARPTFWQEDAHLTLVVLALAWHILCHTVGSSFRTATIFVFENLSVRRSPRAMGNRGHRQRLHWRFHFDRRFVLYLILYLVLYLVLSLAFRHSIERRGRQRVCRSRLRCCRLLFHRQLVAIDGRDQRISGCYRRGLCRNVRRGLHWEQNQHGIEGTAATTAARGNAQKPKTQKNESRNQCHCNSKKTFPLPCNAEPRFDGGCQRFSFAANHDLYGFVLVSLDIARQAVVTEQRNSLIQSASSRSALVKGSPLFGILGVDGSDRHDFVASLWARSRVRIYMSCCRKASYLQPCL